MNLVRRDPRSSQRKLTTLDSLSEIIETMPCMVLMLLAMMWCLPMSKCFFPLQNGIVATADHAETVELVKYRDRIAIRQVVIWDTGSNNVVQVRLADKNIATTSWATASATSDFHCSRWT